MCSVRSSSGSCGAGGRGSRGRAGADVEDMMLSYCLWNDASITRSLRAGTFCANNWQMAYLFSSALVLMLPRRCRCAGGMTRVEHAYLRAGPFRANWQRAYFCFVSAAIKASDEDGGR